MAPRVKYGDFNESEPVQRRGKLPPHDERFYVDIKCPHCNEVFAEIAEEFVKKVKSTKCLQHLRVCPGFEGEVPPKRSTVTRTSAVVSEADREVKVARPCDEEEELRSALRKKEEENKDLEEEIEAMDRRDALQKEMIAELRETCAYWRKLYESQKDTIELQAKLRELRCGLK